MLIVTLRHIEEVLAGVVFMGQDVSSNAFPVRCEPHEAAFHISRTPLLPALEYDGTNLSGKFPLFF